ncbi:alpha-N-acetylneuraminide alpha-2,8-sialyltransferase [Rhinophrynus dorsalis]
MKKTCPRAGRMVVICPRTRLPVGASALCVFVLCWLYIFPVYRLPGEKEIVREVLQQQRPWSRNLTAAKEFRNQLNHCCDAGHLFSLTKVNTRLGENLWFDGELLHSLTIDSATHSLFPQPG